MQGKGNRPWSRFALWCGILTLSACTTLGPDYQEPEVKWLKEWQPTLYGQVDAVGVQKAQDLSFWWRLFDDLALSQLVDIAKRENLSLRVAGLRVLESRAQLGIAGSALYPQVQQIGAAVNYIGTQDYGGTSVTNKGGQSLGTYQIGFNLGWELDFWGRFKRAIESADAAFFASIANQHDAQVLLSAQVADLYYTYRTLEQRIAIARENAAIQKRSYEIAETFFKSGQDSELDLRQAKTQYLSTLSTIPDLERSLTQTRNAICTVLGRPPGELPELAKPRRRLPTIGTVKIRDIPAKMLMRRPDVRAAAWQVAAQSAQIGIAEADYYPAISLLGSIGWSGDTLRATPNTAALTVVPALRWNVFDHGRIANNVRLQDARLQQLIENYQQVVLQAAREIDDAAIGVLKTAEGQSTLDEAVATAQRALELANTRYKEGYSDFQRVLDAQRSLFSQAERQLVNQGSHIGAVIALYKGLGGGWVATPVEQMIPEETRETMAERTDWGDTFTAPPSRDPAQPPSSGGPRNE
jgi:NodT family efflux transporter outer membrane factor (OMF) lipoprotein